MCSTERHLCTGTRSSLLVLENVHESHPRLTSRMAKRKYQASNHSHSIIESRQKRTRREMSSDLEATSAIVRLAYSSLVHSLLFLPWLTSSIFRSWANTCSKDGHSPIYTVRRVTPPRSCVNLYERPKPKEGEKERGSSSVRGVRELLEHSKGRRWRCR